MDTQYWLDALQEWIEADPITRRNYTLSDITLAEFSRILQRAQEIKAAHMEELRDSIIGL